MNISSKEYEDLLRIKIENMFLVEIVGLQKRVDMYRDSLIESEKEKKKLIDEITELKGGKYVE